MIARVCAESDLGANAIERDLNHIYTGLTRVALLARPADTELTHRTLLRGITAARVNACVVDTGLTARTIRGAAAISGYTLSRVEVTREPSATIIAARAPDRVLTEAADTARPDRTSVAVDAALNARACAADLTQLALLTHSAIRSVNADPSCVNITYLIRCAVSVNTTR